MDQTLSEDNRSDYEAVSSHGKHVFDNSNLSQEIFAIDTWGAVISWSQAHAYNLSDYMKTRLKA